MTPHYAILRFAKYKGPEISNIESHNERTKEKYASNPDIDVEKRKNNVHLVAPSCGYRAGAERQIAAAGCRTRKDSVRVVETLVTATPEFFQNKTPRQVEAFFREAMTFLTTHQRAETILSAVVHMDEKTPHMHLSFVPLTADGRLSAKEILGNKKKLIWWQDEFWKHMVTKYPDLERGESASKTGRTHIPPRVFKEAAHLHRQRDMILQRLSEINPLNSRKKISEIAVLMEKYIPSAERMKTQLKKYDGMYRQLKSDYTQMEKRLDASKESVLAQLETADKLRELEELRHAVEALPQEVLEHCKRQHKEQGKEGGVFEER